MQSLLATNLKGRLLVRLQTITASAAVAAASIGLLLTAPAAQAAPVESSVAYCTQTVYSDLAGGYSYCVGTLGTHRVAIYCEKPFSGRWVYGPWKPAGQESHAHCGWFEYLTQIFTQ